MENFGEITHVVKDGDNTLWSWLEANTPAYEAMSQHIADSQGIPEDEVAAAMQQVYVKHKTIEYEGLIQDLTQQGFFPDIKCPQHDFSRMNAENLQKMKKLATDCQRVFNRIRKKNLSLYPSVEELLKAEKKAGIKSILLSDAPWLQAAMRVKHLKVGPYFDMVAARKRTPTPVLPEFFMEKERKGAYKVPFKVVEVDEEKPYTRLDELLQMTREQIARHVYILGDNDDRDMGLVRLWHCRGGLTLYGKPMNDLLKRITRFSPQSILKRNANIVTTSGHSKPKDYTNIDIIKRHEDLVSTLRKHIPSLAA